jgi:hypothetical protein
MTTPSSGVSSHTAGPVDPIASAAHPETTSAVTHPTMSTARYRHFAAFTTLSPRVMRNDTHNCVVGDNRTAW